MRNAALTPMPALGSSSTDDVQKGKKKKEQEKQQKQPPPPIYKTKAATQSGEFAA